MAEYLKFKRDDHLIMHHSKRFLLLDVSRWIAAIGVVGFHLGSGRISWTNNLYLFVDFFFVLSGFVLLPKFPTNMRSDTIFKFIIKRFLRLAPMTYASLLFTIMIELIVRFIHNHSLIAPSLEVNISFPVVINCLLLLQIFNSTSLLLNYPLWSLSVEWVTNLVLIPFVALRNSFNLFLVFTFQFVTIIIILNEISTPSWLIPIIRGLNGILVGILTRRCFEKKIFNYPAWLGISSISIIFPLFSYDSYFPLTLLSLPFAMLILTIARMEPRKVSIKIKEIATLMGNSSFGIYVWHVPVAGALGIVTRRILGQNSIYSNYFYIQLVMVSIFSLMISLFVGRYLEKPVHKLSAKYIFKS